MLAHNQRDVQVINRKGVGHLAKRLKRRLRLKQNFSRNASDRKYGKRLNQLNLAQQERLTRRQLLGPRATVAGGAALYCIRHVSILATTALDRRQHIVE